VAVVTWIARRRAATDARILAALAHSQPVTSYEIWTRTHLRTGQQRRSLDRLERAGLVVRLWSHGNPPVRVYGAVMPGRPPTRPMVVREGA
jgi:predicted ArsR family transcriptional regulator